MKIHVTRKKQLVRPSDDKVESNLRVALCPATPLGKVSSLDLGLCNVEALLKGYILLYVLHEPQILLPMHRIRLVSYLKRVSPPAGS